MPCFEGCFKLLCGLLVLVNEVKDYLQDDDSFSMKRANHIIIFHLYCLSGAADIMTKRRMAVPPHTDYVALLITAVMSGLLLHFHQHGRDTFDSLLHTLLVCTYISLAVCLVVEMRHRHSVMAALGRAACASLQGTWLVNMAFLLFSPFSRGGQWWNNDHEHMMLVTALFGCHVIGVLLFLGALGYVTYVWSAYLGEPENQADTCEKKIPNLL